MRRPYLHHATPAWDREQWAREQAAWYALGRRLADHDPRPADERDPHPAAGLAFLILAGAGIVGVLWLLIVAVTA